MLAPSNVIMSFYEGRSVFRVCHSNLIYSEWNIPEFLKVLSLTEKMNKGIMDLIFTSLVKAHMWGDKNKEDHYWKTLLGPAIKSTGLDLIRPMTMINYLKGFENNRWNVETQ